MKKKMTVIFLKSSCQLQTQFLKKIVLLLNIVQTCLVTLSQQCSLDPAVAHLIVILQGCHFTVITVCDTFHHANY